MGLERIGFEQRFQQIESENTIDPSWKEASVKNSGKKVFIDGKKYEVIAKKERYLSLSSPQRILGIAVGTLLSVITLGLAPFFSKSVKELFTGRQVLHILKEVLDPTSSARKNKADQVQDVANTTFLPTKTQEVSKVNPVQTQVSLSEVLSAYNPHFRPKANAANLETYSQSEDFKRHAKTARVYYNGNQLSKQDAKKVIFQREPTNIAMGANQYNKQRLKQLFGYETSVYNEAEAKKSDGSKFKELPNTASVYAETYMWDPPGGKSKKEIACLSLPAPALDSKIQPHYDYYMGDGLLNTEKYAKEMEFLFKTIERALKDNQDSAFEGKGIKRLFLCRFGQGAFLGALSPQDQQKAQKIYLTEMNKFLKNIQNTGVEVVMSEYMKPNEVWLDNMIIGDIIKTAQEGDLIVNAWDPHSAPGNGNDADKSFDGAMGKGSGILLTQTAWLNETLRQEDSFVAI